MIARRIILINDTYDGDEDHVNEEDEFEDIFQCTILMRISEMSGPG